MYTECVRTWQVTMFEHNQEPSLRRYRPRLADKTCGIAPPVTRVEDAARNGLLLRSGDRGFFVG